MLANTHTWASFFALSLANANVLDSNDVALLPPSPSSALLVSIPFAGPKPNDDPCQDTCQSVYESQVIALNALYASEAWECVLSSDSCLVLGPEAFFICYAACMTLPTAYHLMEDKVIEQTEQLCLSNCGPQPQPCNGDPNSVCPPSPTDPNEMQGPPGYLTAAFVGSQVPWQYTIYFENESNALAFARQIVITNVLNPSFDIRTFRVSEIAFGDVTIKVPANRSFYQARVAATSQNPTNIVVDVTAGVDVQHNTVFWTLNAIDLNTGQLGINRSRACCRPTRQIPLVRAMSLTRLSLRLACPPERSSPTKPRLSLTTMIPSRRTPRRTQWTPCPRLALKQAHWKIAHRQALEISILRTQNLVTRLYSRC